MTSVNPLRVYIYENDALFRFCARPYPHPFNASDLDSYVVGDQYTPTWEMPSLVPYFVRLKLNYKQTFNAYIRQKLNKDPGPVWRAMEESIKTIYYKKEEQLAKITESMYPERKRNFFEMVRFDFTLDEDLNVYLMEANMSPNMASAKYPPNREIYEPVLYSLFSLVGLVRMASTNISIESDMYVLERDLSVAADECSDSKCFVSSEKKPTTNGTNMNHNEGFCPIHDQNQAQDDAAYHCDICYHCLRETTLMTQTLKDAYLEEYGRYHNKRLIPSTSQESDMNTISHQNYLQDKWFIAKCIQDPKWCN